MIAYWWHRIRRHFVKRWGRNDGFYCGTCRKGWL